MRTGIIVANEEVIQVLSGKNAIMALASTGFGAQLVLDMVKTREIIEIGTEIIRPFYKMKAERAVKKIKKEFGSVPFRIHRPEGAMFLWLWFKNLPISCVELYEHLKIRV